MKLNIVTNHPVAYESQDHLEPKGAANDNTKNENYVKEVIELFKGKVSYCDLGCSGGGFVAQFLEQGQVAVGVEGSDYSLKNKRAEWATWPYNLFTADITKPWHFEDESGSKFKFDVISAYDVMEHIKTEDLDSVIQGIKQNLTPGGLFLASIATFQDEGYHHTLEEKPWWDKLFAKHGFIDYTSQSIRTYGRNSSFQVTYKLW